MSFALGMDRKRVAFNVPDGVAREFDLARYRCLFDIRSDIYFRMGHAMIQDAHTGNFSTWVAVGPGDMNLTRRNEPGVECISLEPRLAGSAL